MFIKRGASLITTLCLTASTAFFNCSVIAQEVRPVATVNGQPITQEQLLNYVRANAPQSDLQNPDVRSQMLQTYVGRELIYQDALKQKIDQQPAVQTSLNEMRRTVLAQAYVATLLQANPVTEAMARTIYDQQIGSRKGIEYHARHVLVPTETDATGVIARLKKGEDFGRVAQTVSKDSSSLRGGDLGWVVPEKFPATFAEAMVNLKPGKFTATPIKTDYGWHVILVEANRPVQPPPFDTVRDQIMKNLQDQAVNQHLVKLQQAAKIELAK